MTALSSASHPAPIPKIKRPAEQRSSVAISLARMMGSWLRHQTDPCAQLDPAGHGGRLREADERIDKMREPLRHNAVRARRIGRFADHRNYRMLGQIKRIEAQTFRLTRERHRIDASFSYERQNSDLHSGLPHTPARDGPRQ
jgi:hypothetical protein